MTPFRRHIPDTFEATRKTQATELLMWLGGCTDRAFLRADVDTLWARYPKVPRSLIAELRAQAEEARQL